jgi:hypothetical protein
MRARIFILAISLISALTVFNAEATVIDKKKSSVTNAERQRSYQDASAALKNQVFLVSFYSFINKTGNLIELEPAGNYILVNKESFVLQKSISLSSNTFSGSDNFKGELSGFQLKENKKGNVQFSFILTSGQKNLTFKGTMNNGDNIFEATIRGKSETGDIEITGNIQPVQSHFVY